MANKQDYIKEITLLNYNDATGVDEGMDFFWKEYINANFNDITPTSNYDNIPSNWSWIVPYGSRGNREPSLVVSPYYMEGAMLYEKLTATITTSNNGVDLVLNTQGKYACGCLPNYSFYTLKADQTNGIYTSSALKVNEYTFWHYWIWVNGSDTDYTNHFDTLEECFTHLIYNVRNINIIVDSENWTERTPAYNWVSVPSVSGKNGILSLATIKDEYINNGESVTGASLSNFDTPPNISNVLPLINDVMPDDDTDPTSVRVTYGIPALAVGTYSQIKLLTKKNGIPRSVEDADIVTNLDEPTSITRMGHTVVGNLAELTEYYFTIHVEDEIGTFADSEPVGPVRTGKHEGMIKMQIMITGGISENGFTEAVSYEKVTT